MPRGQGRRLAGDTVEFVLDGEPGVVTTGHHPDGDARWVQLQIGVHGSTLAGLAEAVSTAITVGLQHGTPPGVYADALRRLKLDPPTGDEEALMPALLADCLTAAWCRGDVRAS